jgi:archaellum component FlaC
MAMKPFSALLATSILLSVIAGCQNAGTSAAGSRAEPTGVDQVQLGVRLGSAIEASQQLTQRSNPEDIEAVVERLQRLDQDLSKLGTPDDSSRIRLMVVRAETERLVRARRIQEIQSNLMERIRLLGHADQPLTPETRNRLREKDSLIADLDDQLRTTERQYTESVNRSRKLISSMNELDSDNGTHPISPFNR